MILALIFLIIVNLTIPINAQNNWGKVWTMQQMPFQPFDLGSEMSKVIAGFDTDEDGWGEFICGNSELEKNFIMMYEATADNTYELVWYYEIPIVGLGWFGLAVGDIDNNGKVEILFGWPSDVLSDDSNPPRVFTFEWNGIKGENSYGRKNPDGTFRPTHQTKFDLLDKTQWNPFSMIVEDIDKDGLNELVIGIRSGGRGREVFIASVKGGDLSGFGSYVVEYNYQHEEGGSNFCTAIGDLDNDGNTDIFEMVWNLFTLRIFEVAGPDQYVHVKDFEKLYLVEDIDYGALDGLKIADINGDGKNELFIAGTEWTNSLFIIQNISDLANITREDIVEFYNIPTKIKPNGSASLGEFRNMVIGDPDHDGKLSLIIAGEKNGQIFDLEYKGTGDLADSSNWELNVAYDIFEEASNDIGGNAASDLSPRFYYGALAGDMDNDGLEEYVFVNYSTDKFVWSSDFYVAVLEANTATDIQNNNYINYNPNFYTLYQNYPNPFNPITTIEYSLPQESNIAIKIYNIHGELIKSLFNGVKSAGVHSVSWNGTNNDGKSVVAGIYYYQLQAENYIQSKKMIYLK